MSDSADDATRQRILRATYTVLVRRGRAKLTLSDVAAHAKLSRPTLYRFFPSKDELLRAFGDYEQRAVQDSLAEATDGLDGWERLDAVLVAMVEFQRTHSLAQRVNIEPDDVLDEIHHVMPSMRAWLARLVPGESAELVASTLVRVALCHYIVPGDDGATFLDQLRTAAGIPAGIVESSHR